MTKLIDPIHNAATRGAAKKAFEEHKSMFEGFRSPKPMTSPDMKLVREALEKIANQADNNWTKPLAAQALAALDANAPGHTDLMVSPESIDKFLEDNPPPPDRDAVIEEAREALSWALDLLDINDRRLKELDPEGWEKLDHKADGFAKTRARSALRALLPSPPNQESET